MKVNIADLWCTERMLKRKYDLQRFTTLDHFDSKIVLHKCPDGEIQINDGHHRVCAIWLSGRTKLEPGEYVLCEVDEGRARSNLKIPDLLRINDIHGPIV